MQDFSNKYREQINGTLSGFDRLVFRSSLRRLNYGYRDQKLQSVVAQGMEQYLQRFVYGPKSWSDFLALIGVDELLEAARAGQSLYDA